MRKLVGASAVALAVLLYAGTPAVVAAKDDPKAKSEPAAKPGPQAIPPELLAFEKGLHKQTGDVLIPQAKAVLHLGDRYYFLPAAEAKRVLTDVWGNPPQAVGNVLGLVLEKNSSIFENVWGAVITYQPTGHIADTDAAEQDYGAVLAGMQAEDAADNERRKAAGFPAMTLVGWAQPPSYDASSHSLIWAREILIAGDAVNTLNYDVRLLGRTGVLSLNMVSTMPSIADVRAAAQAFGKAVTFEPGGAYADYDVATDHTADYGLAGLVAGGAAVAVAKKLGFLGLILAFGKKFIILILAGGAALAGGIGRLFGRRREEEDEEGTI